MLTTVTDISIDLIVALVSAVILPADGSPHIAVTISDRGLIDAGTVVASDETVVFYDGIGDSRFQVMTLQRPAAAGRPYVFEHKVKGTHELDLEEVILNHGEYTPEADDRGFRFRIQGERALKLQRLDGVFYLHEEGSPYTIVIYESRGLAEAD